jgi:hypothetical protein
VALSESSHINSPTRRANNTVIGIREMPSLGIPVHFREREDFFRAFLHVRRHSAADLKRRRNLHSRILILPWNVFSLAGG